MMHCQADYMFLHLLQHFHYIPMDQGLLPTVKGMSPQVVITTEQGIRLIVLPLEDQ